MKLLSKYNRVNIAATIVVLLAGGLCYYFILKLVLTHQLDKDLKIEEAEIKDYVQLNNSLPNAANYKDQKVVFEETTDSHTRRKIKSINIYDNEEHEQHQARRLIFGITIAGKNYRASIIKSQQETEDLVQVIVVLTIAIVLLLLIVLFVINRFVLHKLWWPFNNTLQQLKQFNVTNSSSIQLNESNIDEFKELNAAVTAMSNSVRKDYAALKSFTENASHEIQTPLAVINSKLELLMQGENFSEQQMRYIQHIQEEISRLSKLNQSLLLLTKIDNQQFKDAETIDIAGIIVKQLNNYEELIGAKEIILTTKINQQNVEMNKMMAEILVSNLITNAIKHNIKKGSIELSLNNGQLMISNTGKPLLSEPEQLFERFKKDTVNSESLGLGLSIVHKICDQYHFIVKYDYNNGLHLLTIRFSV
jgi:signal transduction histidine kinase